MDDILVSIYCLAYNHGPYIRTALDGFVNQKTNFKYEVVIHDDASTDNTADIIREYEAKYPDIIKPVYQTVNQYSQGVSVLDKYLFQRMKGKYVAICEGDDYWCDEHKLQKQVDFMEEHPHFAGCAHSSLFVNVKDNTEYVYHPSDNDYELTLKEILEWGNSRFQSSSLMTKKEYIQVPDQLKMEKVGDYPRAANIAANGGIFYMKDVMSVYRVMTPGSWSANNMTNIEQTISAYEKEIDFLNRFDTYTEGRYSEEIICTRRGFEFYLLSVKNDYRTMVREYRDLVKQKGRKERIKIYLKGYFYSAYCMYRKLRKNG